MTRLRPEHLRLLKLALPALALVIGLVRLLPITGRKAYVQSQLVKKRTELGRSRQKLSELSAYSLRSVERAVALNVEAEPIDYLAGLSQLADQSGAQLFGLLEKDDKPKPESGSASRASRSKGAVPASAEERRKLSVKDLESTVTVEGTYASILEFFSRLETGDRVTAVRDLKMAPSAQGYPRLTATFTVLRFVSNQPTYNAAKQALRPNM